jgi:hypothetical protein
MGDLHFQKLIYLHGQLTLFEFQILVYFHGLPALSEF